MPVPRQRGRPTHSEPAPDEMVGIQDSKVVEVALPEVGPVLADPFGKVPLVLVLVEAETPLNYQIGAHLDGSVPLPLGRRRPSALRLSPSHHLQVQNV